MLDESLLSRFEDELLKSDAPLLGRLRPGLSYEDQAAVCEPYGILLSQEARTWWRWRDGADEVADAKAPDLGTMFIHPLESALKYSAMLRKLFNTESRSSGRQRWESGWLTVANADAVTIVCDCDVPPGNPSPVLFVWDDPADMVRLPSFESLVELWCDALSTGYLSFDSDRQQWVWDESLSSQVGEHAAAFT